VEKWFGTMPASKKPALVKVPAPTIKRTEVTVTDAFAKLPQISFSWHSPARYAEGDAELDILGNVLDTEGPGRLYKTLVYDKQLAQNVSAGQSGRQFSGIFEVNVTLRTGANMDEVKKIVFDTIAQLTKEVATDREIARTVTRREASTIRSLESIFTRAEVLHAYNHYLGDTNKITWDLDRYRTTTADKVRAAAAKYLTPDRVVMITTQPTGAAK
nr:insulinase family protein [Deltaproteobacteria bacterium]